MKQQEIAAPFERYRELLTVLESDQFVLRALARIGEQKSWWQDSRAWHRTYGSFEPLQPAIATLLFESATPAQEICRVEVFGEKPQTTNAAEAVVQQKEIGWLRVTRFPYDPALPTLSEVLDDSRTAIVLRYRPHKRCTIRFDAANANGVFAKVFPDARGYDLHRESVALWSAAQAGQLDFEVARPIRWDAATHTIWQSKVDGAPIFEKMQTSEAPDLARRLGQAAGSLACSNLAPEQALDAGAQMQRTRRYAKELSKRVPRLKNETAFFLEALQEIHNVNSPRPLRPIHGSPHPHQWLENGARLGLVDFDRISLGEPELDIATFIAEMDFEDETKYPVEAINAAFIAGYESRAGKLNRELLRAYRGHKHFSKALKAARAVRTDGEARAERNLQRALHCLLTH